MNCYNFDKIGKLLRCPIFSPLPKPKFFRNFKIESGGYAIVWNEENALTLDNCLKQQQQNLGKVNMRGLSRRFQKQIAQVNKTPWLVSTSYDLRWKTTIGGQPDPITQLIQKYLDQVMKTAVENNTVHQTLIEVMTMLKPPMALFALSILLKVGQDQLQSLVGRKTTDDNLIHHIPPMGST